MDAAADSRPGREAADARLHRRPQGVRRSHRPTDGRHRVARRLHRVVRLAGRADRDQPPLRDRRPPVQLDAAAEPADRGLPREDARRGAVERPRVAGVRDDVGGRSDRSHHRRPGRQRHRPPAQRHDRPAGQGARGRLREGRPPVQRHLLLRRAQVLRDRAAGNPRRPAGLRAGRGHRRVRRRNRQLAVAAPHRRLELPPRLRRQGRQAGRLRQGQRPVQAEALAEGLGRRHQAGRPRLRRRLPGPDDAAPDVRRDQGNDRVGAASIGAALRKSSWRSSTS